MIVRLRDLGWRDYVPCWRDMQAFTEQRDEATADELWTVEHPPVFTLGKAGRREHVLAPGTIPVVETDRGGQVTYHGPGQLVVYTLLDVRRLGLGPRELVRRLEQGVIDYLAELDIGGERLAGAPGVYVAGRKIAALGLRIRRGCCYHGLALNVAMDLAPYARIDPCGYAGLEVTQLVDLGGPAALGTARAGLVRALVAAIYADPAVAGDTLSVVEEKIAANAEALS
ncbi:MAG: lipoyl(octanoyl) transferase LipB [Gammaproteobacteria bacterium]